MVSGAPPVLVTGASGFLGAHLVAALLDRGHGVTAVVRDGSDPRRLRACAPAVVPVACDLGDADGLAGLIARTEPETIFHLAGDTNVRHFDGDWATIDRAMQANVAGSMNVLRAAMASGAPVRRIIRTGGLEEYGDGPSPSDEAQREQPVSPYSASQATVTHWYGMIQAHTPIMLTTLRPALVYGHDQNPAFLIPALIRALLAGRRFAMGDGRQRRDVIHLDDMTRAFLLAGGRDDLRAAVLNISSGTAVPMAGIAQRIAALLGRADLLDIGTRPPRPMDLETLAGLNALAARRLGWAPQVALGDGLARTIDWHRSRG